MSPWSALRNLVGADRRSGADVSVGKATTLFSRPLAADDDGSLQHQPLRGPRILVVEDDRTLTILLSDVLTDLGYVVRVAYDVAQAIDIAATFAPDLLLVDVTLRGRSGLELCAEWSARPAAAPVVLLTGRSTPEDLARGKAAGAVDYITKPFAISDLLNRVATVVQQTSGRRNGIGEIPASN